jgi:hypothetical protein
MTTIGRKSLQALLWLRFQIGYGCLGCLGNRNLPAEVASVVVVQQRLKARHCFHSLSFSKE